MPMSIILAIRIVIRTISTLMGIIFTFYIVKTNGEKERERIGKRKLNRSANKAVSMLANIFTINVFCVSSFVR